MIEAERVPSSWPGRPAHAAHVVGDDVVVIGEAGGHVVPDDAGVGIAVDEDDGRGGHVAGLAPASSTSSWTTVLRHQVGTGVIGDNSTDLVAY